MSDVHRLKALAEKHAASVRATTDADRRLRMAQEHVAACHELVRVAEARERETWDAYLRELRAPVETAVGA